MMIENLHVAILLSAHNGERFIAAQLESILDQTHEHWSLWICDDGSTDATLKIVRAFKSAHPNREIHVESNEKTGFSQSFLRLLHREDILADYYAISDQDDIWLPEKLSRGIRKLEESGAVLYGGRTRLIDENGSELGLSPNFHKKPSLSNAFVQSIMGGNTMMLTREGIIKLRTTPVVNVASHDWWLYLFLCAAGYKVFYDELPTILYRQHEGNLVGSNQGFRAKLSRLRRLLRSEFKEWNRMHVEALRVCSEALSAEGQYMSERFEALRNSRGLIALRRISEMGLYRQTHAGEVALRFAAFLGKI